MNQMACDLRGSVHLAVAVEQHRVVGEVLRAEAGAEVVLALQTGVDHVGGALT